LREFSVCTLLHVVRVEDKRLLKLIRAFLNAGVMENGLVSPSMENGLVSPSVEGTPQGGPRCGVVRLLEKVAHAR
jgi:retron-type reverse transcriptase